MDNKETVLEVKNITCSFGQQKVIDDLSLDFCKGEIVSLLGENGSGKSTLMKIIVGLIKPQAGEIIVKGFNLWEKPKEALQQISAQIEEPNFYENMSAQDNLYLFSSLKGADLQRADDLFEQFKLSGHRKKQVRKFSIGMRRRLQLAICLSYDAPIYILDEPFSGLDKQGVSDLEKILTDLRDQGHMLLISSHQAEPLLRIQDREILMSTNIA